MIGYEKCKKHPRYQGVLQPRAACNYCWIYYLYWNFDIPAFLRTSKLVKR